jgi:hypothetical protein
MEGIKLPQEEILPIKKLAIEEILKCEKQSQILKLKGKVGDYCT